MYKIAAEISHNKEKVKEYYLNVFDKMRPFMENKQIMGVQVTPEPVIRKYEKGKPIVITKFDPEDTSDHKNFFYYPDKHYVDFHLIHGHTTDVIPIDIDPNNVSKAKALQVAKMAKNLIKPIAKDVMIVDSGGRGYHVWAKLPKPMPTRVAKHLAESRVKPLLKLPYTTDEPPEEGEIRVDLSTFHPGGSIRIPYSINFKTGKPSKIIE